MTFEQICEKVVELASSFFSYAMNVGENRFMIVDADLWYSKNVSDEVGYYFIASFLIMTIITILACDSFNFFHPIEGLHEWSYKIHILKVIVFAAGIFSLHTFYKMFVTVIAGLFHDDIGGVMTNCLGSFINPISVCIMSIAITTVEMRKKNIQAFFLGVTVFITPALLSYTSLTKEHVTVVLTGIILSLACGILYKRFSMYVTYCIMSCVYLIGKFFLVANTEQAKIIDANSVIGKIGQYLSCVRVDIGMIFVFLATLLIYKTVSVTMTKKELLINASVPMCILLIFVLSYPFRVVFPVSPVVYDKGTYTSIFDKREDEVVTEEETSATEEIEYEEKEVEVLNAYSSSHLVTSSGKEYDIDNTLDALPETCWQDGQSGDGLEETLTYEFYDCLLYKMKILNGNRRDDVSYDENNRLSSAVVHLYQGDEEIYTDTINFSDDSDQEEFTFEEGVQCNKLIIEITEVYNGSKYQDTCVAEVNLIKLEEK